MMKNCGCEKGKCVPALLAHILVIIGALNWGLVGIGGFVGSNLNVVNLILGSWSRVEWIVYILVGLAALGKIIGCKCSACKDGKECATCVAPQ